MVRDDKACSLHRKSVMRTVVLRKRNIEWARQWLDPGIRSTFAYILKRNAEFGVDTLYINAEEEYAILRQTMTKFDIQRMLKVDNIIVR